MQKQDDGGIDPETRVAHWRRETEGASPERILEWAYQRWGARLALFTSFQADGMVVIDLICRLGLPIPVLTLDTGRLPPETYEHWDRVSRHYGIQIEPVLPDPAAVAEMVRRDGPNLFRVAPELRRECCRVRKVEPFGGAVTRFAAWISGLRRSQSDTRSEIHAVELDRRNDPSGRLVRISPFVDWSLSQVWTYLRRHQVPTHPLYEKGYHSIGCAPCSRPLRPAEDARSTRWWWEGSEHRECGLHFDHQTVSNSRTEVTP